MKKRNEGRKPISRSLLPIAEACPDFSGFVEGENRSERVYEILLSLIQRYRQTMPRPFYAIREVATFFNMALSTTSMIYKRLHREGAVTLVRSSRTMISPRAHRPKFALRGVVCMPIWMPGFLYFLDWRRWFSELEEELARHRFVLEPIFYRFKEETDAAFVDRVLKFNPDYVLWNSPAPIDRMSMQGISDAGVPILTILGARAPMLPGRIYRQSYDRALKRGLEEWKGSGEIHRVAVARGDHGNIAELYGPALEESSLPYEFKTHESGTMAEFLESLAPDPRTGIFFADEIYFVLLCSMVPEEMFKLFRQRRVMIRREVTMHSLTMPTDLFLDWLYFPGRRLAQRIARDLSDSKGALSSQEETFEAEWRPRTPLADIVQTFFKE